LRRISRALAALGADAEGFDTIHAEEAATLDTTAGLLMVVPTPWGTRGYDDIRIRANRENLGQGVRPKIAATVDLVRMLEASTREEDRERLHRLRRMIDLERRRTRRRGLHLER